MAQQTINSPGVQLNEVDLSLRVNAPNGIGVLAMGFANSGPTDEVIQITSIEEFEEVYGKPTTAAERYSYHTAQSLFDSPANVFFSRLPYGADAGGIFTKDTYSALVYPVIPEYDGGTTYAEITGGVGIDLSADANTATDFYLTKPTHVQLSREDYEKLINDELEWSPKLGLDSDYSTFNELSSAGLIVLNSGRTTINEQFEGYYLGISDNLKTAPGDPFESIIGIDSLNSADETTSSYTAVPSVRLDFELSSTNSSIDSMSEVMDGIASFDVIGDEFADMLSIGLFKLRKTPFNNSEISLSYALTESYFGSFDPDRELQNVNGGPNVSTFLEDIDDGSNNLEFFVNPYLQDQFTLELSSANPSKKLRVYAADSGSTLLTGVVDYADKLFPLGAYQNSRSADKTIGEVSDKIDRVLDLVENPDLFELDIVVEGGLGTIFCSTKGAKSDDSTNDGTYDETLTWESLSGLSGALDAPLVTDETQVNYSTIFNQFNTFCENSRKDCIFIADPIRQILVTGKNSRVLSQTYESGGKLVPKTFSQHIDKYLKNQFRGANSSYSVVYGNWVKVYDSSSKKQVWVPYSGFGASLMANMDYVWEAPAGLTRGINSNINDIAIYPKQKERDQLYKSSINPVTFFPNEGFVTWGQKTMLKKPSAFDRINVRRAFLFLEKATLKTSKYFVFEPNTLFTRTQVTNVLEPLFENVKNKDGIRDYIIVCNEKNNIDEVIEQNQLKIDIYIKPTKIAEFILIDFIATRQDASFQELIG